MLDSPNVDAQRLFGNLQVVIIDEIHAFAGDDRGWHLLSVLERISRIAGRELQRLGLSATVGNPETLVDWLAGSCQRSRDVFLPPASVADAADVQLDYVGSLSNAAVVISRLHRGEKRLVFVDSRARAEQLASELGRLEITTFVTHSSLSQEQRKQAEEAFASRDDCVIVATSVLELGIDVGNLDRVIQIDSPPTVSSFLQRMGRTGRRAGTLRNCLFLATKEETLIQAAALIELWADGYVEPVEPPPLPYHILAQQLMALILQESGIGRTDWFDWLKGVSGFQSIPAEQVEQLVKSMLEREILWEEAGILGMGQAGENTYGRRNFMELFSVFLSPPLFAILYGRQELGYVDEMTFLSKQDGPRILLLGGRAWQINHIDWQRRKAWVEPTDSKGRTRWSGAGQGLAYRMTQAMLQILATTENRDYWSQRATQTLTELREENSWLQPKSTVVLQTGGQEVEWWTYAGSQVNAALASQLSRLTRSEVRCDSFMLTFQSSLAFEDIKTAVSTVVRQNADDMYPAVEEEALEGLKFSECLPAELAIQMLAHRLQDRNATRELLQQPVRYVIQ